MLSGVYDNICSEANHAQSPPKEAQVAATRGSGPTNAPDTHPAIPKKGARGEAPKKTSPTWPAADKTSHSLLSTIRPRAAPERYNAASPSIAPSRNSSVR